MQESSAKKVQLTYKSMGGTGAPELERLLIQKQFNEDRLLKELQYKEESFHLFQNEHHLKLEQYSQQVNTEMLSVKRKYDLEIDGLKGSIIQLESDLRESMAREHQCQHQIAELGESLEDARRSIIAIENASSEKSRNLVQLTDAIKELQSALNGLQAKNHDMQDEILLLLQVQKSQSSQISMLRHNEVQQRQKTQALSLALSQIQSHFKTLSLKLESKESECSQLKYLVNKMDTDILSKQQLIQKLTGELEQSARREKIREDQVKHLINENQRLYNQLNSTRHRLHDLAIAYNIQI